MATSQFRIYQSSDAGGPGSIYGSSGSLITILDACLVNGYTGHPTAGWSKPIANSASVYACYQNSSGSGMTLFVNDFNPNGTAAGEEAWCTGWESITNLAPTVSGSNVGAGYGQFPTPTQLLTTGHGVWRKSATSDLTTPRPWIMFADQYTFYLFILTGDSTATTYFPACFGDIFSLHGTADRYRCFIAGRQGVNSITLANGEGMDSLMSPWSIAAIAYPPSGVAVTNCGRYMPRTWGGGGTSAPITAVGDFSVVTPASPSANNFACALQGALPTPNGPDNSYYVAPLRVSEISTGVMRGRFRGLYQVCHPSSQFSDGQVFAGSGDYAGKTFQIIKQGITLGFWAVETSNTVETN